MLARLDQDLAPLRSSVDREGRLLRIAGEVEPETDAAAHATVIVERMGYVAEPMQGPANVSRWFDLSAVDQLSQEEARVLAETWIHDLSVEGVVDAAERLMEPLEAALLEAFREAARTGTIDDINIDSTSLRSALDESEAEDVLRWIDRKLMRHDQR